MLGHCQSCRRCGTESSRGLAEAQKSLPPEACLGCVHGHTCIYSCICARVDIASVGVHCLPVLLPAASFQPAIAQRQKGGSMQNIMLSHHGSSIDCVNQHCHCHHCKCNKYQPCLLLLLLSYVVQRRTWLAPS